jgi:hypothetical protein
VPTYVHQFLKQQATVAVSSHFVCVEYRLMSSDRLSHINSAVSSSIPCYKYDNI